jgi:hypothetical protein
MKLHPAHTCPRYHHSLVPLSGKFYCKTCGEHYTGEEIIDQRTYGKVDDS